MSEYVFPFEKLDVWQMAVDLAEFVLDLLESFPPIKEEDAHNVRNRSVQIDRKLNGLINSLRGRKRG